MLRNAASLSNYPTSTWAGLPAAASAQGQIVRVTDVGVAGVGVLVISDGTRWMPLGPQVLARSGVAASVTGTLTETALASFTVPANLLGLSGSLRVWALWTITNSANNKTLNVKLGGTIFMNYGQTTIRSLQTLALIRNRGAAASQVAHSSQTFALSSTTVAPTTGAENTAADLTCALTGTLTNTGETITLEGHTVEVLP